MIINLNLIRKNKSLMIYAARFNKYRLLVCNFCLQFEFSVDSGTNISVKPKSNQHRQPLSIQLYAATTIRQKGIIERHVKADVIRPI